MKVTELIKLLAQFKPEQEVKAIGLGSSSVRISNITSSSFTPQYDYLDADTDEEIVYIELDENGL